MRSLFSKGLLLENLSFQCEVIHTLETYTSWEKIKQPKSKCLEITNSWTLRIKQLVITNGSNLSIFQIGR